jgi:group I intron endonuclease
MQKCCKTLPQSGIYAISSKIDERIYIGSSKQLNARYIRHKSELNKGKHSNQFLSNFAAKYGIDNLKFWVIEECGEKDLIEREQHYIDLLFSKCAKKNVMNINPLATKPPQTQDTRNKISAAQKGRVPHNKGQKMSDEQKQKLIGLKHSPEALEKMRNAKLKNPTKYWLGKTHTQETRNKISEIQKGKTISEETKLKKSKKGIWITPSGEELLILNISEYCKINGYEKSNFCRAYNDSSKKAYGFQIKTRL